jgi:TonB family protein
MTLIRVIVGMVLCLAAAEVATAQSLAQLAKQEVERRQAITAPARVIRTTDLLFDEEGLSFMGVPPVIPQAVDTGAIITRRVPAAPALFQSGSLPQIPVLSLSGGEVLLEVSVDEQGRVTGVTVLRDTPAFTESVMAAIAGWRFKPAEDAAAPAPGQEIDASTRRPIKSKVLVAGLFRPPALYPITLGQPPRVIAAPSDAVPAPVVFPAMPLYPPQALFDGVVLAELRVGDLGVASARIVQSSPGLNGPALSVLNGLTFRPARVNGLPTTAMVYVVAAFRQPVTL